MNPRARWGIILQGIAVSLLWQTRFWEHAPEPHLLRVVFAVFFLILACVLTWAAVPALGRQWRLDAGLNADHQLVQAGPYAFVRHPIYTSMLGMVLGTGLIITPWLLLLAALLIFAMGTEVRVRIEDKLLASHFGDQFTNYKQNVPAYIPRLRFSKSTAQ